MRTDNICLVKQDREAPSGGILACWWLQLLPSADVMPPLALPRVFPGWGGSAHRVAAGENVQVQRPPVQKRRAQGRLRFYPDCLHSTTLLLNWPNLT